MWKAIVKTFIRMFAEPIFDLVIAGFEKLAKRTETTVDDNFVETLKRYKEEIIGFIITNSNQLKRV